VFFVLFVDEISSHSRWFPSWSLGTSEFSASWAGFGGYAALNPPYLCCLCCLCWAQPKQAQSKQAQPKHCAVSACARIAWCVKLRF